MSELPSVAAVKAAIPGPAVRQEAAFAVLRDYIQAMAGSRSPLYGAKIPEPGQSLWFAYLGEVAIAAHEGTATYNVSAPAAALAKTTSFQTETLSKFVSNNSLAAYKTTKGFREQAVVEESEAATRATLNALEGDKKRGRDVDLTVFGIPLGEPLHLPDCPAGDSDQGLLEAFNVSTVANTCVVRKATTLNQMMAQISAAVTTIPSAAVSLPIKLAHSSCPNWVTSGCLVLLSMQNGIPLGAVFSTSGVEQAEKIEGLLAKKYRGPGVKGRHLECRDGVSGVVREERAGRLWSLPGLFVTYSPVGICPTTRVVTTGGFVANSTVVRGGTQGEVIIELPLLRSLRSKVEERREDSGPKL